MRILYVTPWFPRHPEDPDGSYIWDAVQALQALGHEVDILVTQTWKPGWFRAWFRKDCWVRSLGLNIKWCYYFSIPRHYLRFISNWSYIVRVAPMIKRLNKQRPYHLINAQTSVAGLAVVKMGKQLNIPTVLTMHGIDTSLRMWAGHSGKMLFDALSQADRAVFVGDPLVRHFARYLQKTEHIRVVYNGFRLYPKMKNVPQENWPKQLRLISVSNLVKEKGIEINIKALAALKKEGIKNWHYKVIGGGCERSKLEDLVASLGLCDQIEFIGVCDHKRVYQYLQNSDVFCLPSYREAFGIAYAEAMANGLLTIAVVGEGAEAFITHGKTGLMMEPENIEHLVVLLKQVFGERERMQAIAREGKAFVLNNFTWENHAKHLVNVYLEAINA